MCARHTLSLTDPLLLSYKRIKHSTSADLPVRQLQLCIRRINPSWVISDMVNVMGLKYKKIN